VNVPSEFAQPAGGNQIQGFRGPVQSPQKVSAWHASEAEQGFTPGKASTQCFTLACQQEAAMMPRLLFPTRQ